MPIATEHHKFLPAYRKNPISISISNRQTSKGAFDCPPGSRSIMNEMNLAATRGFQIRYAISNTVRTPKMNMEPTGL